MDGLSDLVSMLRERISTNVSSSVSNLSAQQWIRLIAVAGAYLLLRPYIIKLGGKAQMRQHEKDEQEAEEEAAALAGNKRPALSPNDLRGAAAKVTIPADSDSEDDGTATGGATATDWGKKARRRQRRMVRQLLEAHEQKLADEQADEEDKDIAEFLED